MERHGLTCSGVRFAKIAIVLASMGSSGLMGLRTVKVSIILVPLIMERCPNLLDFEEAHGYLLPSLTVLLGGDRHGTRPQVLIAHCPLPRRAPDLGSVATFDHYRRRAGPTWEDYPLAGRWPFTIPRGAGGRRPTDRRSQVGEALSGPAPRWPGGRP